MNVQGSVRSELLRLRKYDAVDIDLETVREEPSLALYLASQLLTEKGKLSVKGSRAALAYLSGLLQEHFPWLEPIEVRPDAMTFRLVADPLADYR